MKSTILAMCTISMFFLSCANDRKSEKSNDTASPSFEIAPTSPVVPGAVNAPSVPAPATTNIAGLNPAHGQPGHRCDIAVGAPLNSAPAPAGSVGAPTVLGGPRASVPPSPGGIAPSFSPSPQQQQVVTAPGMNPPHGQPGHDCAIAVGAPLKK